MGEPISDVIKPPTTAYTVVAQHLHPSYFIRDAPSMGVNIIVKCSDRSVSAWRFSTEMAGRVASALATDRDVVSIGAVAYGDGQ